MNVITNGNIINIKDHQLFVIALMEILKLRLETTMLLDELCCDLSAYEQILKQLMPTMFASHIKIRYLFSCIAALIVFHPKLLLSQRHRNKKDVQKEKQCYSPKLLMIYPTTNDYELFHLWIPKFVSSYVYLLCPQHKIRWTSHHTRSFEHIVKFKDDADVSINAQNASFETVDGNELYSQNDKIKAMIGTHLKLKQDLKDQEAEKVEVKQQYEASIANEILSELQSSKNHKNFIKCIQQIMALFDFSEFLDRFCSESKFYLIIERFVV